MRVRCPLYRNNTKVGSEFRCINRFVQHGYGVNGPKSGSWELLNQMLRFVLFYILIINSYNDLHPMRFLTFRHLCHLLRGFKTDIFLYTDRNITIHSECICLQNLFDGICLYSWIFIFLKCKGTIMHILSATSRTRLFHFSYTYDSDLVNATPKQKNC